MRRSSGGGLSHFGADAARLRVNDIMSVKETAGHLVEGMDGRARAFVEVQNGCDHRCTFCIIPYGRGNSRSVPMGAVVDQIRRLVDNGYREVVLTGVDITAYGADLPGRPTLGRLVRSILQERAGAGAPPALLDRLDRGRRGPLRRNRRGGAADAAPPSVAAAWRRPDPEAHEAAAFPRRRDPLRRTTVRRRRPDVVFGADLIAGFPTETEEMFAQSLAIVDDCGLTHLHVFPFSPRPGTPAARMPQLDRAASSRSAPPASAPRGDAALPRISQAERGVVAERPGRDAAASAAPSISPPPRSPASRERSSPPAITGQTARALLAEAA